MIPKTIVITGASGGIGAALAKWLGSQGHNLVLAARREPELQAAAKAAGSGAIAAVTDVTHKDQVYHLRDRALAEFGQVDVWVNNAGRGITKRVLELTDQEFDEMMAVNVKSALYGMQAIVPHFQQRGEGHVINIASFLGRVPLAPQRSAYSAAKTALISLTANLRMDLKPEYPRIHVSVVMPGMVATDFAKNALGGMPPIPPGAGTPKPQTAEEVAGLIAGLIEQPQAELYTSPGQLDTVVKYLQNPEAFEGRR